MFRILFLLLALAGAIALPLAVEKAVAAYNEVDASEQELIKIRRIQTLHEAHQRKVVGYRNFAETVAEFHQVAEEARALSSNWRVYQVNLVNAVMDVAAFRNVINNARHGEDFYFHPESIVIHSALAPEAAEIFQQARAAGGAGGGSQPSATLAVPPGGGGGGGMAEFGSQLALTIQGRYLVFNRN